MTDEIEIWDEIVTMTPEDIERADRFLSSPEVQAKLAEHFGRRERGERGTPDVASSLAKRIADLGSGGTTQ